MIYVGVPNSDKKTQLSYRQPMGALYVHPSDLAWDCGRHIAFLEMARDAGWNPTDAQCLGTPYAEYLRETGRDRASILERCRRFLSVWQRWNTRNSKDIWAIVTYDGLRLDGSHRAAVAVVAERYAVACAVAPYMPEDADWRTVMQALRHEKLHKGKHDGTGHE